MISRSISSGAGKFDDLKKGVLDILYPFLSSHNLILPSPSNGTCCK
jgi:hypothetical protein